VEIDTRKLRGGELFIPLKGQRFDGHTFIGEAISKGAIGFLFEKDKIAPQRLKLLTRRAFAIEVKDTYEALKRLALFKRKRFRGKEVIAITGSAGKTTTKELIAHLLGGFFDVYKTPGNFNSKIGLPLALANADENADFWVFEVGTDRRGNIRELTEILKPTFGVLTSVSPSHLEGFGNFENLLCAKGEIFLPESVKKAVLPQGLLTCYQTLLREKEFLTFGGKGVRVTSYRFLKEGKTLLEFPSFKVKVPLLGKGIVKAVETAVATLKLLGLNPTEFVHRFETFRGEWGRMQPLLGDGYLVIADFYNANPLSTKLALETLVEVEGYNRRVAILGAMMELGEEELLHHHALGEFINTLPLDEVYLYGEPMKFACQRITKRCYHFTNPQRLEEFLRKKHPQRGTVYLLKGSRGMAMERFLPALGFPLT
jgi:UDP-N-acetylmuramoyl-tripeptide--D-alanyl-D-alanine ligase